jgi:AcrR family transcriptional regulator
MTSSPTSTARARNRRGHGTRLRDEIVAAAGRLLDEAGRDDAITLRAVAREVGISAPSIYPHFADRDAIVAAVVDESFGQLISAIQRATATAQQPVERLRAGCRGYLDYAATAPHRYGLLFTTPRSCDQPEARTDDPGAAAFDLLVEGIQACIDAGRSASTDAFGDATVLWLGLHGYATLRAARPAFPWPAGTAVTDHLIAAAARLPSGGGTQLDSTPDQDR